MAAKQQEQQEVLQRHLKFIDRLMADKKELSEKCDTLSSELQDSDKRMGDKLKEVSEQHNRYASSPPLHCTSDSLLYVGS